MCLNALIGLIIFYNLGLYLQYKYIIFLLALCNIVFLLNFFKKIFLYQLRLIFLALVGIFPAFVKLLDPQNVFSPIGLDIQTLNISTKMLGLTSLALLGCFVGFNLVKINFHKISNGINFPIRQYVKIMFISMILILLIGYLSANSYGPAIWNSVYASDEAKGQLLGNLQSMGVIFLTITCVLTFKRSSINYLTLTIFLALYLLVWGILIRGGRLEFLSGLLTLVIGVQASVGRIFSISKFGYVLLIGGAVLMELFGYIRGTLSTQVTETALEMYLRLYDQGILFAGTLSGIATTFANVLHMVENGVVNYQLGVPYLEYIMRTPPEFLFPGRPEDLSAIFEKYNYASLGGFFELAEAYLSFGIFGIFFVPLIISWVIGTIYKKALNGNLFFFFLLIGITSVFLRGAWYQTFAYYKSLITGALIWVFYVSIMKIRFIPLNVKKQKINV